MSKRILSKSDAALLVIDIQEAFRKSISDLDKVIKNTAAAIRGFETLGRPVVVTEQYPNGLGHTVDELRDISDSPRFFEKSEFSACGASGFSDYLLELGVKSVAVAGIETHVCVNQTVHDLLAAGYQVHILEDAVSSRSQNDRSTALKNMYLSGAVPSCVEMALFEMLIDSKSPKFKEIQSFIK